MRGGWNDDEESLESIMANLMRVYARLDDRNKKVEENQQEIAELIDRDVIPNFSALENIIKGYFYAINKPIYELFRWLRAKILRGSMLLKLDYIPGFQKATIRQKMMEYLKILIFEFQDIQTYEEQTRENQIQNQALALITADVKPLHDQRLSSRVTKKAELDSRVIEMEEDDEDDLDGII